MQDFLITCEARYRHFFPLYLTSNSSKITPGSCSSHWKFVNDVDLSNRYLPEHIVSATIRLWRISRSESNEYEMFRWKWNWFWFWLSGQFGWKQPKIECDVRICALMLLLLLLLLLLLRRLTLCACVYVFFLLSRQFQNNVYLLYFPCMKYTQRPWFDFKLAKRVFSPSARVYSLGS